MINKFFKNILEGNGADQATSYLLILPEGTTGITKIQSILENHYGGVAHPDLMMLTEEKLKVEDIRKTRLFLQSKPLGDMKTLWIACADTMTQQAANAFLKSLEEPNSKTRIILTTNRPTKLLATIRSRCVSTSIHMDKKLMQSEMNEAGVDKKDMADAFKYGSGDIAAGILLAKSKDGMKWAKGFEKALDTKKWPGLPKTGKDGLTPRTCALVVQGIVSRRLIAKPTPEFAKKIDKWLESNFDIDRVGLDIKTRILSWYNIFD